METKTHTLLSGMPRKNAFVVPDGYYEELPTAVLLKCSGSKVKKEPLRASKPLWWSVAACSLLLLGIWFVVPKSTPLSDSLLSENETVHATDHENVVHNYLAHRIDPTILENELFLADAELDLSTSLELTDDEILAYLDYHNVFYDDIINP